MLVKVLHVGDDEHRNVFSLVTKLVFLFVNHSLHYCLLLIYFNKKTNFYSGEERQYSVGRVWENSTARVVVVKSDRVLPVALCLNTSCFWT